MAKKPKKVPAISSIPSVALRTKAARGPATDTTSAVQAAPKDSTPATAKAPKRKLTSARLHKLAQKHRPPQSWYDEEQDLF